MKHVVRSLLYVFDHLEEGITVICMTGITILTFIAVVTRFVFSIPIAGAEEIASFMFTWAALFGAAAAFKYNQHGSVPILANRLGPRARRVLDLIVLFVMMVFFAFLAFYTWRFVAQSFRVGQVSPATGVPGWTVNAGIFAALALCGIRCAIALFRDLVGMERYQRLPSERARD